MSRSATQPAQVPGAATQPAQADQPQGAATDPQAARIAELEAQLAAAKAPGVHQGETVAPNNPKGREKLAASATASMTVAQVVAAIDAGDMDEPFNSYLCIDGYYSRRK